jgi:integrase/recombinase XerD
MPSLAHVNKQLAGRWKQWLVALHYAEHTRDHYMKSLYLFLDYLGKRPVSGVTHLEVRQFISYLSNRGATLATVYRHLGVLRIFYDFLNFGGVVSYVAPRLVKLRPPRRQPGPMLSEPEIRRLIAAARTPREKALVEFFYATGCRLGEVSQFASARS